MIRMRALFAGMAVCALIVSSACGTSDPGITTAVKSKFAADDTVKAYQINVDTRDGVVTLTGTVDNAAARSRAAELARGTDGVRSVVDNITVSAPPDPTAGGFGDTVVDGGITAVVKTKLLADTRVSGLAIDVDTRDRVVTLSGTVKTQAQKTAAVEIARGTENVRDVIDQLVVGR